MSKAFDNWWREPFEPSEHKPADIRDLCRRTWNAAIAEAAKMLEVEARKVADAGSIYLARQSKLDADKVRALGDSEQVK